MIVPLLDCRLRVPLNVCVWYCILDHFDFSAYSSSQCFHIKIYCILCELCALQLPTRRRGNSARCRTRGLNWVIRALASTSSRSTWKGRSGTHAMSPIITHHIFSPGHVNVTKLIFDLDSATTSLHVYCFTSPDLYSPACSQQFNSDDMTP